MIKEELLKKARGDFPKGAKYSLVKTCGNLGTSGEIKGVNPIGIKQKKKQIYNQ